MKSIYREICERNNVKLSVFCRVYYTERLMGGFDRRGKFLYFFHEIIHFFGI